jgi:hypothetical protein
VLDYYAASVCNQQEQSYLPSLPLCDNVRGSLVPQVVLLSISSLFIGRRSTDKLEKASHVHKLLANPCCYSSVLAPILMSLFFCISVFKILILRFIFSSIVVFFSTMTALLARFFTGTTRGDLSQEGPTNQTSGQAESARKLRKGHSTSVKARKSITSLFGFSVKLTPAENGFVNIS